MIPERTLEGLKRYVKDKIPPGGFLTAVLENNLLNSFQRADGENRQAIPEIVYYVHNHLPANCWGSPKTVDKWLKREE